MHLSWTVNQSKPEVSLVSHSCTSIKPFFLYLCAAKPQRVVKNWRHKLCSVLTLKKQQCRFMHICIRSGRQRACRWLMMEFKISLTHELSLFHQWLSWLSMLIARIYTLRHLIYTNVFCFPKCSCQQWLLLGQVSSEDLISSIHVGQMVGFSLWAWTETASEGSDVDSMWEWQWVAHGRCAAIQTRNQLDIDAELHSVP